MEPVRLPSGPGLRAIRGMSVNHDHCDGILGKAAMKERSLRHPWLTAGLFLMLLLTVVFAVRLVVMTYYWAAHGAEQDIKGWMPVGYIANSWDVPRDVLAEALAVEPGSSPRKSLARIAATRGESVEELIARIEAAIAAHRTSAGTDRRD